MQLDEFSRPFFTAADMVEVLYKDQADKIPLMSFESCSEIEEYNALVKKLFRPQLKIHQPLDITQEEYDKEMQSNWFFPTDADIDVQEWLLEKCETDEQRNRVLEEYTEYTKQELTQLLKFLIFLVSFMREHKIVWGVGRGSSVASYILFLIGIHKIDSIQYDLDWREFLR